MTAMSHEHAAGATGAGTVVLELGGDVGVLILATPASLLGHEIEISPADGSGNSAAGTSHRTHSMVRERVTKGGGRSYAAVYPGIRLASTSSGGTRTPRPASSPSKAGRWPAYACPAAQPAAMRGAGEA